MQGRLNAFQKSMLLWNAMHPYSAIHVVRVGGAVKAPRLQYCINSTLANRGLARLKLDVERFMFKYEDASGGCELRIIGIAQDVFGAMASEMERELNLPFEYRAPFSPFRFLAVAAQEFFLFGIVYFHPIADAESVALLIKEIISAYMDKEPTSPTDFPNLYPDARAYRLRRHPILLARKLLSLPAQIRRMRRSHRPHYRDAENMANGFQFFSLPPEDLRSLVAAAQCWQVTVNDLFLAVLMKAVSPCAASRLEARRRRNISVGCITNIRRDLGVENRRSFGLFLGSFTVTHEVPVEVGLRELAVDVQRQTARIKRYKLYLGTPLELGLARFALRFFSPARQKKFYSKNYPLWAGITNMNLNSVWQKDESSAPQDYFRGVSTGPVTPLVLSVTTFGEQVNLGVSYRTAVFSRSDIEDLQYRFRKHVEETREAA